MKHGLCFVLVSLFPVQLSVAQIPNNGFELWTSGEPDGWVTTNAVGVATPVTQSAAYRSGSYAIRGEVVNNVLSMPYPPIIQSGSDGSGFTVSQRHASVTGYYTFNQVSGDRFVVDVAMYNNAQPIGVAGLDISTAAATYTQFTATINYTSSLVPDTCIIQFSIIGPGGNDYHVGSYVIIDDLAFSGTASAVDESPQGRIPAAWSLHQNFPNPFNPRTTIQYDLPQASIVRLEIFNVIGERVDVLREGDQQPGVYEAAWEAKVPSGIYFYRLTAVSLSDPAKAFIQTRKMLLLK